MQPVYNPVVPYIGFIEGGFTPGKLIRIQGSTHLHSNNFSINLQCGPRVNPRDDIALHISIRFLENCIIRNSLLLQQWGPEERSGHFPFVRAQPFEILILCEPTIFKIAVNGQHLTDFYERINYQRISHLAIDGDVIISFINHEMCYPSSSQPPGYSTGVPLPGVTPGMVPPYPNSPHQVSCPTNGHGPVSRIIGKAHNVVSGVLGSKHHHGSHVNHGYHGGNVYPGGHHGHHGGTHHGSNYSTYPGYGTALAGGALATGVVGGVLTRKAMKKQRKAAKKALKIGLPVAGVGLGAYALHKGLHHHHHHHRHGHSSSSSSSSSSEEE